jgi:RHS repeat-associated protein
MAATSTRESGSKVGDRKEAGGANASSLPSISLPKGGGAIRGMGEKFATNPITGTGSVTVPVATSPGRSGFGPQLALSYDSGAGNGPYGFGWSLSLPSITRKTDKGLPKYEDADESDVFILSGAEDLVPIFKTDPATGEFIQDATGRFVYDEFPRDGYLVRRYRPRIEGLFARIERWTRQSDGDVYWRSISRDNITTFYGKTEESRIANPDDASQTFSWLICQSYDDKGNAIVYKYKQENSDGIDIAQVHEKNRTSLSRSANRYLKRILYGNRPPNRDLDTWGATDPTQISDWMFEVVFDHGEGHYTESASDVEGRIFAHAHVDPPAGSHWPVRQDPFSTYRTGFEVRTYRLCRRVLMFHHFPNELGTADYLVRSTEFTYSESPIASFIAEVTQSGYVRQAGGAYLKKSLPPLSFKYSDAVIHDEIETIDVQSLQNLPVGVGGAYYQWLDLDGEGLQGVLAEQDESWYYKRNRSPISIIKDDGKEKIVARFDPVIQVAAKPSIAAGTAVHQFLDLAGDGNLDVVRFERPMSGFFKRTEDQRWQSFIPFRSTPLLQWNDPNLKFVDLTGDGHADILITEGDVLTWYPSLAEEGFGEAVRVSLPLDEEKGPRLVFANGEQSIYLADLSGDGLSDLVHIRNSEVCYWSNLGYGRFGAKVTMDHAPWFDSPDQFDPRRIRLADIDGSGTTDIIYLERDRVAVYRNECGNRWSPVEYITSVPSVDDVSSVAAVDLLGNGTACLVWSSQLPSHARSPMRYIDLMGGQKPHLLVRTVNNLGAETVVQYAPSTKFYLDDKEKGKPWISRLPFPVHCVERVETYDRISRNRFVSRYSYHNGYFDGVEREFRGFGMVEQTDTEEIGDILADGTSSETTNLDEASFVPPIRTKTWFHTGVYDEIDEVSQHFAAEYYGAPSRDDADYDAKFSAFKTQVLLDDTILPQGLTADEEREASRALKGAMLRQEVYGLDRTDKEKHPYAVTEQNFTIERLQPQGNNCHAVFFIHAREVLSYHYERNPDDPRIGHAITLEADKYGNVLKSVGIGYGRKQSPLGEQWDRDKQTRTLIMYTESEVTNSIDEAEDYRTPLPSETRTYELLKLVADNNLLDIRNRFGFDEMVAKAGQASDGNHDLLYEDIHAVGAAANHPYRRLIEQVRTLYRPDDLGIALNDPLTLLPLGTVEPLGLPGETYKLAFTPGLLTQVFRRNGQALLSNPGDVLGSQGTDRGGYADLDNDDHWWAPSGLVFLSPDSNDTAPEELAYARKHFFLPHRYRDPFANEVIATYDSDETTSSKNHNLLLVEAKDPLGNVVTVKTEDDDHNIAIRNDYRVLQPYWKTDPNLNRTQVEFDALGMVVATAVMGKPGENKGDNLTNFKADLTQNETNDFHDAADPHALAETYLKGATTRIVYDLLRFHLSQQKHPTDSTRWEAPYAATLARETHASDRLPPQGLKIQTSFSYSDGFGREIQKKIQAEPGRAPQRDVNGQIIVGADSQPVITANDVNPRWVGSGWTVFNNKGKPVRQYESFFTDTHRFEFDVKIGVSPVLFYDPFERVVATLHPNHTLEKVVFDPWQQTTYDVNDTVLNADGSTDPKLDGDVKGFFSRLPTADYLPTWYEQRIALSTNNPERVAAQKAAVHRQTPTVAHFDTLRRTFLTVAHNRFKYSNTPPADPPIEEFHPTRVELDIENNQRAVRDAITKTHDAQGNETVDSLGRIVMQYDYDMLGNCIHQASMEAGERWMLNDVVAKPVRAWDSRGYTFRTEYDKLRRATRSLIMGDDPQDANHEICFQVSVYGESAVNAQPALNLRGKMFLHCDSAGVVVNADTNPQTALAEAYDFKGNPLRTTRRLAREYKKSVDWNGVNWNAVEAALSANQFQLMNVLVPLLGMFETESFTSSVTYDALNRPLSVTSPDGSIYRPTFNEANLLEKVNVNLPGAPTSTPFVTNIDYNAKGQRDLIAYGNGAQTKYEYDPLSFRLTRLQTRRPTGLNGLATILSTDPVVVQEIYYTYDPAGNISRIADTSLTRLSSTGPADNAPCDYTYDAIYRLTEATGREHIGQAARVFDPPDGNRRDYPFAGLADFIAHPNDLQAMRRYTELYKYDAVGNFEFMRHITNGGGWTRDYEYAAASLIESVKQSNRLTKTTIGNGNTFPEAYTYTDTFGKDVNGCMTAINSMKMAWDFQDQLRHVDMGGGGTAYYVYDGAGHRMRKVTERQNGTRKSERIYLGGAEVYREYDGNGNLVTLERETLHVMDDKQRIALIETKTLDVSLSLSFHPSLIRYQFGSHLGSASLELDDAGQIISYEEYYPYGGTSYQAGRSAAEVSLKRYRYTAMERDEETGLNYHGARYFATWLGRWVSCDPSSIKGGLNLYSYGACSPVLFQDTTGDEALTFPLPEGFRMYKGRYVGITQTLPPPGVSRHKKAPGSGRGGKSTEQGGQKGREGGLEGGVGTAASKATKYATTKYIEEGANGPGGLGEPGDIGTGTDVGTGESGTGSPTGTGTETRTGEKQGSGEKPGGKKGGSKEGSSQSGEKESTNPGDPSLLGDLAALASFIEDPGSLHRAKESGNKGTGAQIGIKSGIISGLLGQIIVVLMALWDLGGRLIKETYNKLKEGLKQGYKKLRGGLDQRMLTGTTEQRQLAAGSPDPPDLPESLPGDPYRESPTPFQESPVEPPPPPPPVPELDPNDVEKQEIVKRLIEWDKWNK